MKICFVYMVKEVDEINHSAEEKINDVVHRYSQSVLRLAYAYVKNVSDAEDVSQEVFITYLLKAPAFEREASRKAWILKTTCNKCKDFLRAAKRRLTVQMTDDLGYMPKESSDIIRYVMCLDEKYRIPIHLYYYEGLSIAQIAALTHLSAATAGTRLSRARHKLKQILGEDFNEQ